MKKVNFKVVLMALSFAFAFLVMGVNRAGAQSGQSTIGSPANPTAKPGTPGYVFTVPQGSFVGSQEAQDKLMAAMLSLKSNELQSPQNSPIYIAAEYLVRYYNAISGDIEAGGTVAESISTGLSKIAFGADAGTGPTQAQLTSMKNSAVALLSN